MLNIFDCNMNIWKEIVLYDSNKVSIQGLASHLIHVFGKFCRFNLSWSEELTVFINSLNKIFLFIWKFISSAFRLLMSFKHPGQ
jgi:hypothetical protein